MPTSAKTVNYLHLLKLCKDFVSGKGIMNVFWEKLTTKKEKFDYWIAHSIYGDQYFLVLICLLIKVNIYSNWFILSWDTTSDWSLHLF